MVEVKTHTIELLKQYNFGRTETWNCGNKEILSCRLNSN